MPDALVGVRVAITRPEPGPLGVALVTAGAEIVHVPLIEVGPPDDDGAELAAALAELGDDDWLVVTSPNGVSAVTDHIDLSRLAVRLAAVGPATARRLADAAGRAVDLVPTVPRGDGLVAQFPPGPHRILVAQADRAAPTVVDGLGAAGHEVRAVTAYVTRTRPPTEDERDSLRRVDAVIFASGSAVEGWRDAMADDGDGVRPLVVAIGPTTATAARRLGLEPDAVAATPDVAGVVAALRQAFATHADHGRTNP